MRSRLAFLALFATVFCLPATLIAQAAANAGPVNAGAIVGGFDVRPGQIRTYAQKVIACKVFTPQGEIVPHAKVEILNNAGGPFYLLLTDGRGEFDAVYEFFEESEAVKNFTATIKISKKGFQTARRIAQSPASAGAPRTVITLRPVEPEDPALLPLADLIESVAPRLRQLGPADGLPAKFQKDYARAAQEFLDRGRADRAVPNFFEVARLNRSCLKCRTMLALAELSWGDWDSAQEEITDSVNMMIANPKLGIPEPFVVDGVLVSWGHDPAKASSYFAEALTYAPQYALALQEHGRAQCLNMDWRDGSESLKKALAAGAGPEARLLHAEALLWTGTPAEAVAEMNLYLDGRNPKSLPPRARAVWERIQSGKKEQTVILAAKAKAKARGKQPLDYIHNPPKNLADFEAASDQEPLEAILAAVGKNVSKLFTDLPNLSCVESVRLEKLTSRGGTDLSQQFKYRYLALAPEHPWGPSIDEFRADTKGKETPQLGFSDNFMLTSGFVSAPLILHPAYQSGSTFRLLGRQKVKGRNTYVLAYAQEPSKSHISGAFQYGSTTRPTYTQGLAWVDAETYQIIHLTKDLLNPLPQVNLEKQTTDIEFSEVHFNQGTQTFWLPNAVTVTLDWNGKVFRNNHAYSDFIVFNVQSSQKIGRPKGADKTAEETNELPPGKNSLENPSPSVTPPPYKQ